MAVDPKDHAEGDRVRAVHFSLDDGLRIWPIDPADGNGNGWRVVRVAGDGPDATIDELFRGDQLACQAAHPEAVFGINDNESVPPGTEGTVEDVTSSGQVGIAWDNGRRLFCSPKDVIEKL